ncbi:hypothetical protein CAEBREN_21006 [Caenorhabditis brenneri]|uniref:Uncharacterized protein n=1 Tax=Caenorhabditis brenneri TaxID=135651 RepID=G0MDF5_CAEBE|nr:hypothetical protein CAEBREN_21006 [Caenorhabditis brenneri]
MTNRTPRCSHRDLHNERVSRQALEQELRDANERILDLEAEAFRRQDAENERHREQEENIRRMANDYWMRVAAIQLQALNRENQLNGRIAELEQALVAQRPVEDEVPEDPIPGNEVELPDVEEVANEGFGGVRDDEDDNLPEIPFDAAVERVENGQN